MRATRMAMAAFLCAGLGAGLFGCAKKTVVLENRFKKGQVLRYRMTMKGEGTSRIGGLPGQKKEGAQIPVKLRMELVYRMLVKDVDARGTAEIDTTLEKFSSTTESGGMKVQMEADKSGARMIQGDTVVKEAPGLEDISKMFRKPMTTKIDRRGRILSLAGPQGSVDFGGTDLFNLIKQSQVTFPEGPVAIGQAWKEKRDLLSEGINKKIGAGGSLKLDSTYRLVRLVRKKGRELAEIEMTGEVSAKDVEMGLPQSEKTPLSIKAVFDKLNQKVNGTIYFDPKKGELVSMGMKIDQDIVMSMRMAKGDQKASFTSGTKIAMTVDLSLLE